MFRTPTRDFGLGLVVAGFQRVERPLLRFLGGGAKGVDGDVGYENRTGRASVPKGGEKKEGRRTLVVIPLLVLDLAVLLVHGRRHRAEVAIGLDLAELDGRRVDGQLVDLEKEVLREKDRR